MTDTTHGMCDAEAKAPDGTSLSCMKSKHDQRPDPDYARHADRAEGWAWANDQEPVKEEW